MKKIAMLGAFAVAATSPAYASDELPWPPPRVYSMSQISLAATSYAGGDDEGNNWEESYQYDDTKVSKTSSEAVFNLRAPNFLEDGENASGHSYANIATGKIGAYSFATLRSSASAYATYATVLKFEKSDWDGVTPFEVGFDVKLDGSFALGSTPSSYAGFNYEMVIGGGPYNSAHNVMQGVGLHSHANSALIQEGPERLKVNWDWNTRTANYRYLVSSNGEEVPFMMALGVSSAAGGMASFGHTLSVSFNLPAGLKMSDESGVFLTDTSSSSPVPEPASWAMLIGGFALVGGAVRRRNSIKTVASFA